VVQYLWSLGQVRYDGLIVELQKNILTIAIGADNHHSFYSVVPMFLWFGWDCLAGALAVLASVD